MATDPQPVVIPAVPPDPASVTPPEPSQDAKTVPYSRFAEVNTARKEAEEKLAAREAADQTAQEEKLIAEGKKDEVLASQKARLEEAEGKVKEYEKADAKRAKVEKEQREELLGKLDEGRRKIGEAIGDPDALRAYVDEQTVTPREDPKGGGANTAKDELKPKPGESAFDYNIRVMALKAGGQQ